MLNNKILALSLLSLLASSAGAQAQAPELELKTLFTTPQERQIINSNRYKTAQKAQKRQVTEQASEAEAVRELVREEVNQSYVISGITINADGSRMAWLNNKLYENGVMLESGSKLRINNGPVKSITIIAPDGKTYSGTSGETLSVSYLRAMKE